jgi:hypothetical protein
VLAVSTGGQANCTAKTAPQELAQVVQQQMAAGGSVGGGAQGGSTASTGSSQPGAGASTGGAANTSATSTGMTQTCAVRDRFPALAGKFAREWPLGVGRPRR